jgi:magnesium chelatase subunit I
VDLEAVPAVLRGKLEFESGEEGREEEILEHLLRRAVADTARFALRGVDLSELAAEVATRPVRTGERVPAVEVVAKLPQVEALTEVAKRLDAAGTEDPGPMASAAELALEYLFLTRKLAKDSADDGDTVEYG